MTIRDPEYFRGMDPNQMLRTLVLDAADERMKEAQAKGARCINCFDVGMDDSGRFCGCDAGRTLSAQAMKRVDPAMLAGRVETDDDQP